MGLENSCRLCLKDLSGSTVRLEEGDGGYFEIAQHRDLQYMVLDCFEIVISDDEIVTKVCSACNVAVRYVTQIRKKVKSADEEIRKYYTQVNVKEEIEGFDEPPQQSEDFEELIVEAKDALAMSEFENEPKIELMEEDVDSEGDNSDDPDYKDDLEETDSSKKYEFEKVNDDEPEEVNEDDDDDLDNSSEFSAPKVKKKKLKKRLVKNEAFNSRCYICSTDFSSTVELSVHLTTHVESGESGPKVCHICNQAVFTVRSYNSHLRRKHFRLGIAIPCDECSKLGIVREYSSKFILDAHKRSVHEGIPNVEEKKHVCTYCGKKFSRRNALRAHENRHTRAIMYDCDQCSMSFTSKMSLTRHERVHTAEKPFKCDQCDSAFSQSTALKTHKATRHNEERPFSCEICGVRFKNKYVLRNHLRTHERNGQGSSSSNRLQRRSNPLEKPVTQPNLKCDFCPALYHMEKFLCQHILEKHPLENVPMIQCELCKAKNKEVHFLTQTEANNHTEYHARIAKKSDGERQCVDCKEMFPNSVALKKHRASTHLDSTCSQCGKDFKTPMSMRRHVLTVHLQERPYKCDRCSSSFGQLVQLTAHLKTHNRA